MQQGNLTVLLHVRDVSRSLEFYCEVLGARLAWVWDEKMQRATARSDRTQPINLAAVHFGTSEILLNADSQFEPAARITSVIQLQVEDVDAFHRSAVRRGLKPGPADPSHPSAPTDMPWGVRAFYVRDPDGQCISFGSEAGRGYV